MNYLSMKSQCHEEEHIRKNITPQYLYEQIKNSFALILNGQVSLCFKVLKICLVLQLHFL